MPHVSLHETIRGSFGGECVVTPRANQRTPRHGRESHRVFVATHRYHVRLGAFLGIVKTPESFRIASRTHHSFDTHARLDHGMASVLPVDHVAHVIKGEPLVRESPVTLFHFLYELGHVPTAQGPVFEIPCKPFFG
jgi:hypothetical protein